MFVVTYPFLFGRGRKYGIRLTLSWWSRQTSSVVAAKTCSDCCHKWKCPSSFPPHFPLPAAGPGSVSGWPPASRRAVGRTWSGRRGRSRPATTVCSSRWTRSPLSNLRATSFSRFAGPVNFFAVTFGGLILHKTKHKYLSDLAKTVCFYFRVVFLG